MIPSRQFVAAHAWRWATALALTLAACQRREGVAARSPLQLGADDEWAFATNPGLPVSAEQLRDTTGRLFEATGRFVIVSAPATDAAHVSLRVLSVDAEPVASSTPDQATVQVHVRLEYRLPHETGETSSLVASASGTSLGIRDQAGASAAETAIARAVRQLSFELEATNKTNDELVSDLRSGQTFRVAAALEHLAARRHPAAFEPLLGQLHSEDSELSLRALSALVSYEDPRAVPAIIDEAEHRDFAFFLEALYALGSIGGEGAEAYLFTVARGHNDPRAQAAATEALDVAHRRAAAKGVSR